MKKGLFIFHRDFRIIDNKGLIEANKICDELHTCFIFTPEQVTDKNDFRSQNSIQFMIESLTELSEEIKKAGGKLHIFFGNQTKVVAKLIDEFSLKGIYYNKDYTPYAKKRDEEIVNLCKKKKIGYGEFFDYYLFEPGTVQTTTGSYYKKFTPFYNDVLTRKVLPVSKNQAFKLGSFSGKTSFDFSLESAYNKYAAKNVNILVHGGRTNGVNKLKEALNEQKQYKNDRDYFTYETTRLSAYLKYGCISVREMYYTLKKNTDLIRQLIWREFYMHVLFAYPEVIGKSYQEKYRKIKWKGKPSHLKLWKEGKTGFPMVDASMRELNTTGYMHNRGRMLVATVLVKILLIDWREGEKYFATKLTDYDVASNNGNWQNISSTGVDMTQYFRYMSPWSQSIKFDPKAEYIKKWVPELKNVDVKDIHKWDSSHNKYKINYPKPIISDIKEQIDEMMEMYKNAGD